MKLRVKDIFGGALSLTLSALIVKLIGVIYKVPLSYVLNDEGMGYFNTAYTVYGFFYILCSAGVPKAITCIISEEEAEGREASYSIYRFALRLFAIFGSIITAIYMLFSPLIAVAISNTSAIFTMLLIGPSILFVATGGVARGYLSAKGRLMPIAISQVIEAVCKLVLGLLLAHLGAQLHLEIRIISALAVLGIVLGSLFSTMYLILCSKSYKQDDNKGQKSRELTGKLVNRIFKIAAPITLGSSVLTFSSIIDMALIMRCLIALGYTESYANEIYGNYTTLAVPMVNLVISLVSPLTVYLLPKLVKTRVRGDGEEMRRLINGVIRLSLLFVCPCIIVFSFYSFDVLDVLFTAAQSVKGFKMLSILSVGILFLTILNVLNTVHESFGLFRSPIISLAVGTVVKLTLEPYLILRTSLGVLGVPLSTVISYAAAVVISALLLRKNLHGVGLIRLVIIPTAVSLIVFGIPYFTVFSSGILGQSPFSLLLLLALLFVIYCLLSLTFYLLEKRLKRVKINKNAFR